MTSWILTPNPKKYQLGRQK